VKVFVFDLLAYDANLDHLKNGDPELPYPLAKRHFDADTAMRTYEEHLDAWEALDRFGYDGVGFNEHHCSPYGLMNSPNLMAAAAAQRTKNLKLLIYGNLLPVHQPLRLAEELAMIDCLSKGRLISGFARGIPREYQVHNVPLAESRARFEEAYDIITRAWTEEVFSYEGQFWSYKDVALWPRPVQQPHPPIWIPVVGSQESIEFAARHNCPITPGLGRARGLRDDIIREYGPHILYFNRTLFSHGNFTETETQRQSGYSSQASTDYVRPENLRAAANLRSEFRNLTMEQLEEQAEHMPMGTADEVIERIIDAAESAGANTVQLAMNRGALPHDLFMAQIERFAREVLPALQAHEVKTVPAAEEAMA
jgi:alkanesulfonate monooxygenase SsuD/methylene tetrahydromethanopterin reductase-like flavin-dependent oxidoreductase (luciferase family)